jgi:tRNA modification GTPase
MKSIDDLICALATPAGTGALAIIRISGNGAWKLTEGIFTRSLSEKNSHTIHFGQLHARDREAIDEVLVSLFEKGKSFTGEESVEITCHGSPYIQQQILTTLIEHGCRMALPGEFTQRAFLNGKMDLSQAEAVSDVIAAQTKMAHAVAFKQLRGGFSSELSELREKLIHFASMVELELDFGEEDVEFADRGELTALLLNVSTYIRRLVQSFSLGNALRQGVPVAIVGAPNTGKSTLLNCLLGEERALVSDIAGTTRDVIEETLTIKGILFRLIDTAGIRENADTIEAMGIERSFEKINKASIVICMADLQLDQDLQKVELWAAQLRTRHPDKAIITVGNKLDISQFSMMEQNDKTLFISALKREGVETLKDRLVGLVMGDFDLQSETIVTNVRHVEALQRTLTSLEKAYNGLNSGISADFVAMDIRQAMYDLGTITGDISTEDLLGNIFSKFCIGK